MTCVDTPPCPYHPPCAAHSRSPEQEKAFSLLTLAVAESVDPPLYRAVIGQHDLCPILPCADCPPVP